MYVCTRLLAFFSDCRPSWSSLCFSPPPQTTLVLPTITWHRQQKQHSTARGNHLYTGSSMIAGGVSRPRSGALVCRYKLYVFHTIESYVYNVSGTYQKYMTTARYSSVDYQLCDKKKGQQTIKPTPNVHWHKKKHERYTKPQPCMALGGCGLSVQKTRQRKGYCTWVHVFRW